MRKGIERVDENGCKVGERRSYDRVDWWKCQEVFVSVLSTARGWTNEFAQKRQLVFRGFQ